MSDEKSGKGGMTVSEAGRRGGAATVERHGREHMQKIGTMGGNASPMKFVAGSARVREIAGKGGSASGGNFAKDPARAAEAGRKGGRSHKGRRRGQSK